MFPILIARLSRNQKDSSLFRNVSIRNPVVEPRLIACLKLDTSLRRYDESRRFSSHTNKKLRPDTIVDFVCLPKKLIIEVDGGQHATRTIYDFNRTRWLESQGYKVLRFWNNEVLVNTENVLEIINKHL